MPRNLPSSLTCSICRVNGIVDPVAPLKSEAAEELVDGRMKREVGVKLGDA